MPRSKFSMTKTIFYLLEDILQKLTKLIANCSTKKTLNQKK